MQTVDISSVTIGGGALALIAGPCVIENRAATLDIAQRLADVCAEADVPFVFKASYDKANRTAIDSYRGPGIEEGLDILAAVRDKARCPILSDVHSPADADRAGAVLDVLQVPAFLCRQTDLVVAAAATGKAVSIKKGQFLAPWDMENVVKKAESTGNRRLLLTERGASFGYNNLVSDMRSLPILRGLGYPVVFDGTHSVQLPGGQGAASGGEREMIPCLVRAAAGAGIDALFLEVHPEPDKAPCDAASMLPLDQLPALLADARAIHAVVTHQS